MSQANTIQKEIFNQLDNIYNTIEQVSITWETNLIPVNTLEKVITAGIVDLNDVEDEAIKTFMSAYNDTLNALIKECKDESKAMGKDKLPISVFKHFITQIKNSVVLGSKKPKFKDKFKKQPKKV